MGEAVQGIVEFDNEWFELVMTARSIGLTIEEVREFLKQSQANKLNHINGLAASS